MVYQTTCASPVGLLTLACDDSAQHLTGLWIEGQKYHGATLPQAVQTKENLPVFHAARAWLKAYFAGEQPAVCALPLAPAGSEFRQAVWRILCAIPYGEVLTYGDIAQKMAQLLQKPGMSAQAVGGAVGHNPLSILIPCHRVVGKNGSLTGYAGGIDVKVQLLTLEGAPVSRFFVPKNGTAL